MLACSSVRRRLKGLLIFVSNDALHCHFVLQLLEVSADLRGQLVTAIAVLLKTIGDDIVQYRGAGGIQARWRRWLMVQDSCVTNPRTLAVERHSARCHLIQHRSKGEKICARIQLL